MREILFRGKRTDNDEWAYGFYLYTKENTHPVIIDIICRSHIIYPETVGQYTGLTDKNGVKLFEGDIVECWSEGVKARGTVTHRIDGLWIIYPAWQKRIMWGLCPDNDGDTTVEVIGNIHDNPEILKNSNPQTT